MKSLFLVFLLFIILCGCQSTPAIVTERARSATPVILDSGDVDAGSSATNTVRRTQTPIHISTQTPKPTKSPKPTATQTPTKTPVPASAILYQEDFEDGIANHWRSSVGIWEILEEDDNHYWHATGPGNYPQSWLELDDEINWTDYAFESRIRLVKGSVFVCVRSENGGSSFYNAAFSIDDWVALADYDGTIVNDGSNYQTFGNTTTNIQPNKWYLVRVEVQGNDIRLYIDDKLITSGSRDSWPRGGIGYYLGGEDTIDFDDIRVWSLKNETGVQQGFNLGAIQNVSIIYQEDFSYQIISSSDWNLYLGGTPDI